jgi:hypothetical protein
VTAVSFREIIFGIKVPFVSSVNYFCDVDGGTERICTGARFVNPTVCPSNSFRIDDAHDCTKLNNYEVHSIFRHASDRDTASTLAVGEKQSAGLVCAFAEAKKQTAGNSFRCWYNMGHRCNL